MDRLHAIVVDANTGAALYGVPSDVLVAFCRLGAGANARYYSGEWQFVGTDPKELAWRNKLGHEVVCVKVVLPGLAAELDADDRAALAELRSSLTVAS